MSMKSVVLVVVAIMATMLSGCLAHSVGSPSGELPPGVSIVSFDHLYSLQELGGEVSNVFAVFERKTGEEVWRWDLGISNNRPKALAWGPDEERTVAFVYHWSDYSQVYLYKIGKEECVGVFAVEGWHHNLYYSKILGKFILGSPERSLLNLLLSYPVDFQDPW